MDTPDDGEGVQQDIVSQSRVFLINVDEEVQFFSSVVVVNVVFANVEYLSGRGGGGPPLWFRD